MTTVQWRRPACQATGRSQEGNRTEGEGNHGSGRSSGPAHGRYGKRRDGKAMELTAKCAAKADCLQPQRGCASSPTLPPAVWGLRWERGKRTILNPNGVVAIAKSRFDTGPAGRGRNPVGDEPGGGHRFPNVAPELRGQRWARAATPLGLKRNAHPISTFCNWLNDRTIRGWDDDDGKKTAGRDHRIVRIDRKLLSSILFILLSRQSIPCS